MRKLLFAGSIIAITVLLHVIFQVQLTSPVIAPLVLATWVSLLFKSPGWAIFTLIIVTELLSQTPPGAMAAALLLPMTARPGLKRVPVGFTLSFLGLVLAVTAGQLLLLLGISTYVSNMSALVWPAGIFAILGSGISAFLICIVWYELTTRSQYN